MIITIQTKNRTYIIDDAEEMTVEVKNGLVGEQIPSEEGLQGFRFKDNE